MVGGGTVAGILRKPYHITRLVVRGTGGDSSKYLTVYCTERLRASGQPVRIQIGDSVWWQGEWIMWSPRGDHHPLRPRVRDVQMEKIGYSADAGYLGFFDCEEV